MKLLTHIANAMLPQLESKFRRMGRPDQVQTIIDYHGRRHLSKEKDVGWRTKRDRATVIHAAISLLEIENILKISQKHISKIIGIWADQGIAPATFQTRMSHLRWFAAAIGRGGMVRDVTYYGYPASLTERTYAAVTSKSFEGNGLVAAEIILAVADDDEFVACQLEGQLLFGLRTTESMLFRPDENIEGNCLVIKHGTKGGRTRIINITTGAQRDWLVRAAVLAKATERGNLIPAGSTYKSSRNHRNYIVRKHGLTKAALGVVAHGLRAQYAEARYEAVSGTPAPTRGGQDVPLAQDEAARRAVSRELGHSRQGIAAAYVGARPSRCGSLPPSI